MLRFSRAFVCTATLALSSFVPWGRAAAQISLAEYAERRTALAASLDDGVFVARGAREPVQDYLSFFQSPGFQYLTGYREGGAALLMTKTGATITWTLFVQPKVPAQEVWSGSRHGPEGATQLTGIPARPNSEFDAALRNALNGARRVHVLADLAEGGDTLNGDDAFVRKLRSDFPQVEVASANRAVALLRGRKSPAELDLIRKSVAISMDAHREAIRAIEPGMNEFELQALVEYTFRRNGADRPAYASIVGAGENSTTLHYNRNDRFTAPGDIIVMDVGAHYQGYAADITRSFPVSGTFTPEQRAIYQIVRDAQAAAERNAKPGMPARTMSDSARHVIAQGLARLGLIDAPDATYDCGTGAQPQQCPQVALFYMHGLGHGIGLEVHDPDQYYVTGVLAEGSAFTIEPGIYVRGHLVDVIPKTPRNAALAARIGATVRKYANIGVRIEDDYIITKDGLEWVSCGLPREAADIEALMAGKYAGPPPRDAAKIDWYRGTPESPGRYEPPASCVKM